MPTSRYEFNKAVSDAFKENPEKEYSSSYLNDILVNWRDVEARLRHTALFVFVAAAFGELLIQGRVTEVQLAGLTIKSLSIFQKITPVVVGYLIYDFCNLIVATSTYGALYRAIIKFLYPKVTSRRLDEAVVPPMSLLIGESTWAEYNDVLSTAAAWLLGIIRPFLIIGAPLVYIVHQFIHLAAINQADGLFWICVGLTSSLIVASFAVVISWLLGGYSILGG
jgi:hypothetical protein